MAGVEKVPEEFKRNLIVFDPLPGFSRITPRILVQHFDGTLMLEGSYFAVRMDLAKATFRTARVFRVNVPLKDLNSPVRSDPVLNLVPDPKNGLVWKVTRPNGEVTLVDESVAQRLDNIANRRLRFHKMFTREKGREPIDEFDFENWKSETMGKKFPDPDLSEPDAFIEDWKNMVVMDDNLPIQEKKKQS